MSSLSDSLLKGYERYYSNLVDNGFIGMNHVNRLVIAGWVNRVVSGKYGVIPTNEQYAILDKLYMCVEGDCLVPYHKYCSEMTINKTDLGHYVRVTEMYSKNRILEGSDNNIRTL